MVCLFAIVFDLGFLRRPCRLLAAMAALFFLASSCSVREDRRDCPCILVLDMGEETELLWVISSAEELSHGRITAEEESAEVEIEAPRGPFTLQLVANGNGLFVPGEGIMLPEGSDFPPLMVQSESIDATACEEVEAEVSLHKRHAVLEIKFSGVNLQECETVLESPWAGLDDLFQPLEGDFRVSLSPSEDGICRSVLPPQGDSSLRLLIFKGSELLGSFPLGRHLADAGYDWDATDLEDIVLKVEFLEGAISFNMEQWGRIFLFNFVY